MGIRLFEHKSFFIYLQSENQNSLDSTNGVMVSAEEFIKFRSLDSKPFNKNSYSYLFLQNEHYCEIKADYCIGIDWLGSSGRFLIVEPKINSKSTEDFNLLLNEENKASEKINNRTYELDYLEMLLQVSSVQESNIYIKELTQIDWNAERLFIEQKKNKLTPFLIIHFLQLLKSIVRKGIKKNYYKVDENLSNRYKGKILVSQHIKQNALKNRTTSTYCQYQVFAEDNIENRFLKKVLRFVTSYVENQKHLLSQNYNILQETIKYCTPAFELISNEVNDKEIEQLKYNPFFKEYGEAIQIGRNILKNFGFNISKTSKNHFFTPPFWIDMPRLFELFVYSKMVQDNPGAQKQIFYQFSTLGNSLDILVSKEGFQMVIDTKYKLKYQKIAPHDDIRQVSGYARLKKVREKLKVYDDKNIDCLIIYPDLENGINNFSLNNILANRQLIQPYYKVYKLGVKLPYS